MNTVLMLSRNASRVSRCLARPNQRRHSSSSGPTKQLVDLAANLKYEQIPPAVVSRTKELFADYVCCALAGRGYASLAALERFALAMGPESGSCEVLAPKDGPSTTSAYFAAMLNGAAGHIVEQDDLHNASVVHPATVVFPAALAAAQDLDSTGKDFLTASVAGYEVACRVGEMLGPKHYRIFHTTGTAGTLGSAIAVSHLLRLTPSQALSALGTAGTQSAGLWQFASDAAMSKQVHTAHAAATGLMSAYTARDGLTGADDVLLGARGMAKGMAFGEEEEAALTRGLGEEWKVTETSFKYWASCRHTHPSADALHSLVSAHGDRLRPSNIKRITAHVYNAALDVLRPAEAARTVHESKFSMGFVLATVVCRGSALLADFDDAALQDETRREVQRKVEMRHSAEVQAAYPKKWIGHVEVELMDGEVLEARVTDVKGDPENTLSRTEITEKGRSLVKYGGWQMSDNDFEALMERMWKLDERDGGDMFLLPNRGA